MCDAEETQPAKPWDESHGISMTTYRCIVCYIHPYWQTAPSFFPRWAEKQTDQQAAEDVAGI